MRNDSADMADDMWRIYNAIYYLTMHGHPDGKSWSELDEKEVVDFVMGDIGGTVNPTIVCRLVAQLNEGWNG